jgi:integrase
MNGSIQAGKKSKDGSISYRLFVSDGYGEGGKRKRHTKTIKAKNPREAEKELALFIAEVETGQMIDNKQITFKCFSDKWIEEYAEQELAPKTILRYKQLLDRINFSLGHRKLISIRPIDLVEFYNNLKVSGNRTDLTYMAKADLKEKIQERNVTFEMLNKNTGIDAKTIMKALNGKSIRQTTAQIISRVIDVKVDDLFILKGNPAPLSDQTIKHHHRLIHAILETAVRWQYLKDNPASRIDAPKVEKKEARHFDEEQTMILLEALENEPLKYKTIILLTIYGGLRAGEVLGLEWNDIDFNKRIIEIKRSSQYVDKKIITKSPKNETSCRLVTYPQIIMTLLKEYKVWWQGEKSKCVDKWHKTDRLFVQSEGLPMHPTTPSKWYLQFIRRHNEKVKHDEKLTEEDKEILILPEVNFHGLRHTSATLLISQGHDIQTVAARLGHSTASTTLNIYSHALRSADSAAADGLESMLTREKQEGKNIKTK